MFVVAGYASSSNGSIKVTSHYPGLAARSGVKNDSSRIGKPTAPSLCTLQSVAMGDKTAGAAFAFGFLSCVFAYSRE